jgi:hypothetical protein
MVTDRMWSSYGGGVHVYKKQAGRPTNRGAILQAALLCDWQMWGTPVWGRSGCLQKTGFSGHELGCPLFAHLISMVPTLLKKWRASCRQVHLFLTAAHPLRAGVTVSNSELRINLLIQHTVFKWCSSEVVHKG